MVLISLFFKLQHISGYIKKTIAKMTTSTQLSRVMGNILAFPILAYMVGMFKDFLIQIMKTGPIPKHVAVVMDGNRRYAKSRNMALKDGHMAGAEALIMVLDTCFKLGIEQVTIYAFSIENFNRPEAEVNTLFTLLRDKIQTLGDKSNLIGTGVRVRIIGNKPMIPADILADLEEVEQKTAINYSKILNVCIPYTSRDDITHSIQSIVSKVQSNELDKNQISEDTLNDNMYFGPDTPKVDILIRTSGHTRLSDFMLWQCNYNSTIELINILWPDFKFVQISYVIMKWSYFKTLYLEDEEIMKVPQRSSKASIVDNALKDLPPPPPLASVTKK